MPLKPNKSNWHFTWKRVYINSSYSKNVLRPVVDKMSISNQQLHPPPSHTQTRAVYGIMWKNIVEPDRPQMKIWHMRCWIPKIQYVTLIAFFPATMTAGTLIVTLYVHCMSYLLYPSVPSFPFSDFTWLLFAVCIISLRNHTLKLMEKALEVCQSFRVPCSQAVEYQEVGVQRIPVSNTKSAQVYT